ncbi:MAG: S-ribosylhomocysteine lyase [Oscillospiraceae bacterium]|jgi:S-ribosylhomocysteine lyase|nr:S-ribosylhomocysteine lyase [Oscillospiraceae bacterium]
MKRIASFAINHDKLKPGLYTSRVDGDVVTYDLRTIIPNCGTYMDNGEMHSFEHLFATYARNGEAADKIIYFGPMGCRTGFYLLVRDTLSPSSAIELVQKTLGEIAAHNGEIPGASPTECGNAAEHDLPKAKALAERMAKALAGWTKERLVYEE